MLHLHADPIRDTRFAGGRHPFVDWNRTVTHAVANYKKHEALKITFRVSRFPARTLGQRIRKRRLEMGLKQRPKLKREMNSTSRGSPVDELKRRSVTTGRALVGTTAPSDCQLPPVAAASVPVDAELASIFLFLLLLKRAAMIRRIGLVVALAVMWLPSDRANMGRGSWACSGPSISPVTLPRVLSS